MAFDGQYLTAIISSERCNRFYLQMLEDVISIISIPFCFFYKHKHTNSKIRGRRKKSQF